ncbi:GDP-mannose pyrophosphatase NudK [Sphingobacteriaceae bacterium]|nr:GDP-mannose pyrophosphatase NudK [Sphingobacteriaceae bacterium]
MKSKMKLQKTEILSSDKYLLKKITYDYLRNDGKSQVQSREVYDRGNAATILLYNKEKKSVILTRQFRLPTFLNGNENGMLIEACAGMLDKDSPEEAIKREAEEETGYKITEVRKVFEAYTSPGSLTELLYFFIAEYSKDLKVAEGGGLEEEHEEIEVLELDIEKSMQMIESGEIKDAKTIMLLLYIRLHKIL